MTILHIDSSILGENSVSRDLTATVVAELTAKEAYGRPAEVWEVANVMVFLASEYSSYMTGETIAVSSQRA